MARLGCICGAEMTNTIAPSKNRLSVFYMNEVEDALRINPQITLWDFYSGWDEKNDENNSFQNRAEDVEYWYCTECGRVHEVQAQACGKILRTFKTVSLDNLEVGDLTLYSELLVLDDVEMDNILISNEKMTLEEYLKGGEKKYLISSDEKTVIMLNANSELINAYKLENGT